MIDLGAGHGDDLDLARVRWPGARLLAVEAMGYHAALLEARGFEVHVLDIERDPLPASDATVDVIIANQILEHAKELFWILHECARVLRVGGVMVVGVPNLASLHNRLLLLLGRQPTSIAIDSAHVRGFTRRGMARVLERAGRGVLRLERHAGSNFYPLPPGLARVAARAAAGLAVSSFFLIRKMAAYDREFLDFVERSRFETNYFVGGARAGSTAGFAIAGMKPGATSARPGAGD